MFPVPDRVIGERWVCTRCDCGQTSPHKPVCWNCGVADHVINGHKYHAPTGAAFLHPMLAHVHVITEETP